MDTASRLELALGAAEEVITREELETLLAAKAHPVAYDGFEPSGLAHLPFGVFRPLLLKDFQKAGIRFKLLLADWHGWINNKMGGDLEAIKQVGEYFLEVWKAAGVDLGKVEAVWASDLVAKPEYWKRVITVAKNTTVQRATRCLSIMGRKEGELLESAQYFYPAMQVADIFELGVDICQLGLDQRRANILSREIADKLKWQKPVLVHHHMLAGLQGRVLDTAQAYDESKERDAEIASKMSKSKPQSAIFVHDSPEEIRKKIQAAYCAPKDVKNNPLLDYAKHILFRASPELVAERPATFGGELRFGSYGELERAFAEGKLHPADLKSAVAAGLETLIRPVREHFEKNRKARELYEVVKARQITR